MLDNLVVVTLLEVDSLGLQSLVISFSLERREVNKGVEAR